MARPVAMADRFTTASGTSPHWFESRLGADFARQIWSLGIEAREHLDWLIRTYNIDAQYLPGLLHLCHKRSYVEETRAHVDDIMSRYPDSGLRFVDQDEARSLVNSDDYYGGYLDSQSGHLHALNLALGIARAAGQHGARLYERVQVTRISRVPRRRQVGKCRPLPARSGRRAWYSPATATCAICSLPSKPASCRSTTSW